MHWSGSAALTEGLWLDGLVTVATRRLDKVLLRLLTDEGGAVAAGVGVPGGQQMGREWDQAQVCTRQDGDTTGAAACPGPVATGASEQMGSYRWATRGLQAPHQQAAVITHQPYLLLPAVDL